jgi:hypothetical protein
MHACDYIKIYQYYICTFALIYIYPACMFSRKIDMLAACFSNIFLIHMLAAACQFLI